MLSQVTLKLKMTAQKELSEEIVKEKSADSADKSADSADSKFPLSDRQKQILSVMDKGKEYGAEDVAVLIGLKGPRTRQLLSELVDMELLSKTAVTRGRKYIKL